MRRAELLASSRMRQKLPLVIRALIPLGEDNRRTSFRSALLRKLKVQHKRLAGDFASSSANIPLPAMFHCGGTQLGAPALILITL